jgi:hypothetical protein
MDYNFPTRINIIFGIIIALVYCAFGIFLFFSDWFLPNLQTNNKMILGAIIFGYGIFRSIRLYRKYPKNEENNNE